MIGPEEGRWRGVESKRWDLVLSLRRTLGVGLQGVKKLLSCRVLFVLRGRCYSITPHLTLTLEEVARVGVLVLEHLNLYLIISALLPSHNTMLFLLLLLPLVLSSRLKHRLKEQGDPTSFPYNSQSMFSPGARS